MSSSCRETHNHKLVCVTVQVLQYAHVVFDFHHAIPSVAAAMGGN